MRTLEDSNPIVITAYYLIMSGILMFSRNPVILLLGFLGVISYLLLQKHRISQKSHLLYFLLFLILTAVNPFFSHNGKTILFVVNNSPFTLEAIVYGAVNAGIIVTVLYLFRAFTEIMTRDKLLYVFGSFSSKLALVLSMGIRYVALFRIRAKRITENQRAIGLYKEENILDKIKSDFRVFSILITWALENGIITADSMSARGYGTHRRTYYSPFRFRYQDWILLIVTFLLTAVTIAGIATGDLDFSCYPAVQFQPLTAINLASYISFGFLSVLPVFLEMEDRIKWNYLQSRI